MTDQRYESHRRPAQVQALQHRAAFRRLGLTELEITKLETGTLVDRVKMARLLGAAGVKAV